MLTLLNGSAELFKHPSLPPANNSLGKKGEKKKNKNAGVWGAAKELPMLLLLHFVAFLRAQVAQL